MVRGDIVGGLKVALSRGEPLQKAMQSFYNAGYKKEEIEEAARELHRQLTNQETFIPRKPMAKGTKPLPTQQSTPQQPSQTSQKPETKPGAESEPKQEDVEQPEKKESQPTQQTQPPSQGYYTPSQSQQPVSYYGQNKKSRIRY